MSSKAKSRTPVAAAADGADEVDSSEEIELSDAPPQEVGAGGSDDDDDVDEPPSDEDDENDNRDAEDVPDPDDASAPPLPSAPPSRSPPGADELMRSQSGQPIRMHREVWGHWSMSDYGAIKVRGPTYLDDGVKIPPACPPALEIVHLEIYQCDQQIFHVCSKKDNWLQRYRREQAAKAAAAAGKGGKKKKGAAGNGAAAAASAAAASASPSPSPSAGSSASDSDSPRELPMLPGADDLPDLSSAEGLRPFDDDFFFVVVFHVQTAPCFHLVMYFQRRDVVRRANEAANGVDSLEEEHDPEEVRVAQEAFDRLFTRWIAGDSQWRSQRLKLLPFLVEGGNWFVSKAVGNRPAILGNKIRSIYHCNPEQNYMEVDIDVSASRVGSAIFRVVKGYASYLTLDLTLILEGQDDDELPESILGGCRLRQIDLSRPEFRDPPLD